MRINNGKIMSIEDMTETAPVYDLAGEPGNCDENALSSLPKLRHSLCGE